MSRFFSDESQSLEKTSSDPYELVRTPSEKLSEFYEIPKCVQWIQSNHFHKVCLQFPDHLLPVSSQIATAIQNELKETVYILADTSYESCCVDYVAATHIEADAVIHFGPVCFSKNSGQIPSLNIYERENLNVNKFLEAFNGLRRTCNRLTVILDTGFVHLQDEITEKTGSSSSIINVIDADLKLQDKTVIFVLGKFGTRKLPNLKFSYKIKNLYFYQSEKDGLSRYESDEKITRRRYFLIEKIRDSNTVGIVIGTLAVRNYLGVIERTKKLLKMHGKKHYVISVGKPTVAKLANFPEIDIYAVITCALNEIYDSRDFYKPIVTPFDLEMALNSSEISAFTYDYNDFLERPLLDVADVPAGDVSLLTGKLRHRGDDVTETSHSDGRVALKSDGTVTTVNGCHGAGYLHQERSWRGLEQNVGVGEVKMAEEGRHGLARHYQSETSSS